MFAEEGGGSLDQFDLHIARRRLRVLVLGGLHRNDAADEISFADDRHGAADKVTAAVFDHRDALCVCGTDIERAAFDDILDFAGDLFLIVFFFSLSIYKGFTGIFVFCFIFLKF